MRVLRQTVIVAALSFMVTMAVMAVVSQWPGMDVPPLWWIIGGVLPLAISAPVTVVLSRQAEKIRHLNKELQLAYESVKHAAETDILTGIANRAAFDARVSALRLQHPGWFLVVDIDHFKAINDNNGHAHGDAALIVVADTLRGLLGPNDVVGRLGGEEFGIFLAEVGFADALATAEAIRLAVAALAIPGADGRPLRLTVSIGLTEGAERSVGSAMSVADRAMYRAKQNGRDRVHVDLESN